MSNLTLKDLAIDHDYYCSDSNYYSDSASMKYPDFNNFYQDFGNADIDLNLVFRWDVQKHEDNKYYLEIFMIQQRKGKFIPIYINNFNEDDVQLFIKYIEPHIQKLKNIWKPLIF